MTLTGGAGERAARAEAPLVTLSSSAPPTGEIKPIFLIDALRERLGALARVKVPDYTEKEAPRKLLRVAVISDLNGSYGSMTYRKAVHGAVGWLTREARPDLVLSTGDMVAGMKPDLDYEGMWLAFHRAVTLPLTRAGIPLAPTPGNHDAVARAGHEEERRVYRRQWRMWRPDVRFVDDAHYPRRYAFIEGGVLFVSLDATTTGALPRRQLDWLDDVLARHRDVPVKIVYGHLPIYPFARRRGREILGDQALEATLLRHGVSAYLSGHHHAYYPGKRGGLRMVSMSCLGGGPRVLDGAREPSPRSVAVLEIDPRRGILSVEAFSGEDFSRRILREELPPQVGRGEQVIVRDDL